MANKIAHQLNITDSAYYILIALVQPQHGYAIMKQIEELTTAGGGEPFKLGPATLYTTLTKLQEQKLITEVDDIAQSDERRKPYLITDKGRQILKQEVEKRSLMVELGRQALGEKKDD